MLQVFGEYSFDESSRELRRGGDLVKIDPQQLDLLALFLRHRGKLLTKEQIIQHIWGGRAVAESVVSVAIAKLRKALGRPRGCREYLENRYGRGYRFLHEVKLSPSLADSTSPAEVSLSAEATSLAPFVGRAGAFEQLRIDAEHAQFGRGRICLLTGEPGIGKTRLAECLAQFALENCGMVAVWSRCQSETSTPLWPVQQLMRGLSKHGMSDATALAASMAEHTASEGSFAAGATRLFGPLDPDASIGHETLDTLAQSLLQASRRRPLLLIVDDIQWADSASLRVFSYLADVIAREAIFLVCCSRSVSTGPDDQRGLARLRSHRNCQRLELQRLSALEVALYVRGRFGHNGRDNAELSRTLFARSEGNPFFMVDLLRTLDAAQPNSHQLLNFSSRALDAMRERLQDLPSSARQVLSAAAVIGHDFDIGLLSHVTGSRPEATLQALDSSLLNQTVIPKLAAPGAFHFDHELIREVLYKELTSHERAQLHLRAADGLLRRRNHGGEVTNAELAHHFLLAQPHGDIEVAVSFARAAAEEASRLAAHAEARDILRNALDVLRFHVAPAPEMRAALLLQLALVERVQGDPVYRTHLATAVSIAREHRLGRLLVFAGQLLSVGPDLVAHTESLGVLEAANETLEADDYESLAVVQAHLAWTPPNCHSAQRVDELLAQANTFADKSSSVKARAALRDAQLYFGAGPDTLERSEQLAQRIEQDWGRHPETASQARRILVGRFRLISAMQRGDRTALERAIEARAKLLSKLRNAEVSWHHERLLVVQAINEGAFAQVEPSLIMLRERARRLELHASRLLCSLDYGVFLCRTSDVSSLAGRTRAALQQAAHDSPQIWAGKIRSMVDFGLHEEAKAAISNLSIRAIEDLPRDRDYLAALCHLAAGAGAVRSLAHCEALLRLLHPYSAFYAVSASFHCEGSVASHLGLLFETLGQLDLAKKHYAHGREREQAFGLMPSAAMTGFRLARLQMHDAASTPDGLLLLKDVLAEATRMGMEPLARAARELGLNSRVLEPAYSGAPERRQTSIA